jgi:hypothetical protein
MKLKDAIKNLGTESALNFAKEIFDSEGIDWEGGAKFVFSVIANDLERVPGNIGCKNDSEKDVIKKWLVKYQGGFNGRASQRTSNPPGTVTDPIIEKIIVSRLENLSDEDLKKIKYAHRLGMSAENILGLILEEYLSENLIEYGWHCAWGGTVKSVDFVHENGSLLQIKNRSNSENSSSSTVRDGTEIKKWYRIKADRVEYMWPQLNEICGTTNLSEDSFVDFVQRTLTSNPDCLAVEDENPWKD